MFFVFQTASHAARQCLGECNIVPEVNRPSEPETIKICPDCNSTVTVVDGPVTVQKNFYSFGLGQPDALSRWPSEHA